MAKKQTLTWSAFCSEYAKKKGCTYKQALTEARADYYKHLGKEVPPPKEPKKPKERPIVYKDDETPDNVALPVEPKRKKAKKNVTVE